MAASLIFAESALETVPAGLRRHSSVRAHARRLGRRPSEILLDNSWHYAAMRGLRREEKRGRPDITHLGLLEATSTPLYSAGGIRIYVHTAADKVISVGGNVRLPRSYHRFEGVLAKLFRDGRIDGGGGGAPLLEIRDMGLGDLVREIGPSRVIGLSTEGEPSSPHRVARALAGHGGGACVVIGGFQKGHFAEPTKGVIDDLRSIGGTPLESHVVAARILYEYENTIFM